MTTLITVEELQQRMSRSPRPSLVDVRSPSEFACGHVPCATNIPLEQFESRISDLPQGSEIVLICKAGSRARIAAGWLQGRGGVAVLDGGTDAWRESGKDIVCTSTVRWSLERQVRFAAGLLVLISTVLAVTVLPAAVYLAMFIGAGLTFAGFTDICPMGMLLARAPWNRKTTTKSQAPVASTCCR